LPADNVTSLKECKPLSQVESNRPEQISDYKTWGE
jgi:hypothetical protein